VTYFIQSKLQDRVEKRRIAREKIEKIYGPLYSILQEIKTDLLVNLEYPSCLSPYIPAKSGSRRLTAWEKIKEYPAFFSIPSKLREEAEYIISKARKMEWALYEIRMTADRVLTEEATSGLKPYYEHVGSRILGPGGLGANGFVGLDVITESKTGKRYVAGPIHKYVILKRNLIEDLKNINPDFSIEKSSVHLIVADSKNPNLSCSIEVSLSVVQEDLNHVLDKTTQKVTENGTVSRFLEVRDDLSQRIDRLIPIISRHIEKHYPIEKI
jgi:hypothetical protein